jgi:hypothetical protein
MSEEAELKDAVEYLSDDMRCDCGNDIKVSVHKYRSEYYCSETCMAKARSEALEARAAKKLTFRNPMPLITRPIISDCPNCKGIRYRCPICEELYCSECDPYHRSECVRAMRDNYDGACGHGR